MIDKQVLRQKQSGFSMVELIIALAIIGVLTAIAVPSYLKWLPNYKLKNAVRELKGNFQNAKLEAIKRNATVMVVFTPGTHNVMGKIGSYLLFVDTDNDSVRDPSEPLLNQVSMKDQISLITAVPVAIRFSSRGMPNMAGTVEIRNEKFVGKAVINIAGRVRLERKPVGGSYAVWN